MTDKNVLVLGGDKRMVVLADILAENNNSYICYNEATPPKSSIAVNSITEIPSIDIVILPIPSFDKNGILNGTLDITAEKIFSSMSSNTLIFGGKVSDIHKHLAKEYGHRLLDYGENERFNIYNAIPTAEAAVLIAMQNSEYTVHSSDYIVIGYGKIGKVLSKLIQELCGNVTVVSRNSKSLALAECQGFKTMSLKDFCERPLSCNICFNTVPSIIITEKETANWSCDKYIELASFPGGLDNKAIKDMQGRYISALSLPGKYFPVTSGKIIYKIITNMLSS